MNYRFDHLAQQVPDIEQAVAWYLANVPGSRVLYQDFSWAFLDACGAKLAFVRSGDHPQHAAWRVSDEELERLATRHGKEIVTHRDKTRSFYLEAPGDQWVEFIAVTGSPWEEMNSLE